MTTFLVDTNLAVLLVVGSYDIELVADRRHKRCNAFDATDFDLLDSYLHGSQVVCTPHAMAEVSNLVRAIGDPLRSALTTHLGLLIPTVLEEYTARSRCAADVAFAKLGIADASVLAVASNHELLTTDLDLYLGAIARGYRATNFFHLRDAW